jgi:ABC-type polysaccharide/polyol phosphate transport system ATPase subunit
MGAKLSEYSAGMRARLAFATVIQTVEGIVMVDELLSVGDLSFQNKCLRMFEKILNAGNTILFISHGIGQVRHLCSRALYIDAGNQVAFGDVVQVEEMYVQRYGQQQSGA